MKLGGSAPARSSMRYGGMRYDAKPCACARKLSRNDSLPRLDHDCWWVGMA
jgi:hypothetical protein